MKKTEKLHIGINYGSSLTVIPTSALALVDKAKKFDIKVLFLICSSEKYREGKYLENLAKELECEIKDIENSISFWNGAGVLMLEGEANTKKAAHEKSSSEEIKVRKRAKVSELPEYSSAELNSLLEKHNNVVELIDECQNILGKIFTASDIKLIMALIDYLGLDNDYILVLMHYAARNEIKSLRYIEKIAVSCMDDGFTDAKSLQIELYAREEKSLFETKIKNLFGIGSRKLTSKEQKQVDLWINEFKYEIDVIEKAYEITISATSKPSLHYAHAILEKWYAEGVRSIADVEAMLENRKEEKREEGSSFDLDDFFNAALNNSYSDKE